MSDITKKYCILGSARSPTISVNIPVYNSEAYLAETIESALDQTFQDFELIICNDGSSDRSLEIIHRYANQDSRIVVISRENRGIVLTRNEMLSISKGKFIAVLDHDDIALSNRFELQVKYLEENPEVVCVGGDTRLIDNKGRYLTTLVHLRGHEAITQSALQGHGSITHSCAMIRTDTLKGIGGYDLETNLAEDLDLWLRLGEQGKLENIATPIVNWRLHDQSGSELYGAEQRKVAKLVCDKAAIRRGIASSFEATEMWRPSKDRKSRHKFMLQYGWWAWASRQRKTAMIYALKAIRAKVVSKGGWELLACALFRPFNRDNRTKKS